MTSKPFRVKGSSIRSKLLYLQETRGEDAEVRARDFLEDAGVWPVLEATWYPFEVYDALLTFMVEHFLGGEVERLQEVGRFSARKALTSTYDAFRRSGEISRFLEKLPVLHRRYYSEGVLVASLVLPGATRCELILEGAPRYTENDLQVAAGFYAGCAELMDHKAVECDFRREQQRVRFTLRWQL